MTGKSDKIDNDRKFRQQTTTNTEDATKEIVKTTAASNRNLNKTNSNHNSTTICNQLSVRHVHELHKKEMKMNTHRQVQNVIHSELLV